MSCRGVTARGQIGRTAGVDGQRLFLGRLGIVNGGPGRAVDDHIRPAAGDRIGDSGAVGDVQAGPAHPGHRLSAGGQSDGLVRIQDAQLTNPDTHRAYVYRSHSGRYGIVNSEEGYQNLRRFLFGGYQVAIRFGALDIASTGADAAGAGASAAWQADLRMSVRGLPVVMDERLAAHYCPIQLTGELASQAGQDGLVPLTNVFLLPRGSARGRPPAGAGSRCSCACSGSWKGTGCSTSPTISNRSRTGTTR